MAADAGADLIFSPVAEEIYPAGFGTEVRVSGPLTETLEGAHRGAAHFHGVTTVVAKLFNIVQPEVAVFGAKDAQQLRVIEQMVRDLNVRTRIVSGETVREPDGLALSSRNARLDAPAREQALAISEALGAAAALRADGTADPAALVAVAEAALTTRGVEPEYIALCDPTSLAPLGRLLPGQSALLLIAATVRGVRLIDNTLLVSG